MKTKFSILTMAFCFIFIAVKAQDVPTKIILNEAFQTISINDHVKVEIVQAPTNSIDFSGGQFEESGVSYSLKNGVLKLSTKNASASNRVTVYASDVSKIVVSDLGQVSVEGLFSGNELFVILNDVSKFKGALELNSLIAETNDASNFEVNGTTKNLKITANDASKVNTLKLQTAIAIIDLNDAAKAQVQSNEVIKAKLSDASSLNYLSDAENISIEINDVARVKQLSDVNDNIGGEARTSELGDSINRVITDILVKIDSTTKNLSAKDAKEWHRKLKKSSRKFNGNWGGIWLGFNNYVDANNQMSVPVGYEYLDPKFTRSLAVGLNLLEQNINIYKQKFGLITGIGFQWNNYFFANNATIFGDSNVVYGGFDVANANKYTKSKLTSSFITVPLIFEYQTNHKHNSSSFHINAGAIFGLRLSSHTKIVMEDTGKQKYKYHNDFHLNPIRADLTVGIGYGLVNLIGTYSLTTLFKENKGPQLYPVSVGLYLALW
jgi:hypothetical protein